LKGAVTSAEPSASPKKASALPTKATSPCEVSIGAGTLPANCRVSQNEKSNQTSYVLTQFMSPLAIVRFRHIVAVTATMLAFAFLALVVLAG
jgi:hypothetical protein